jgi:hypothetical protein
MYKENSRDFFFGLIVATIAFLVYANSLRNGFTLDDESVILNNPALKGTVLSLFSSIDTTDKTLLLPYYRPFTYLTFMFEAWLHGLNPFFVRLFNVLLHSANSFLVYRLARLLFKDNIPTALIAALLFAVHPLQSEGVDFNAGGRNTMLACFFCLATYLIHSRSIVEERYLYALSGPLLFLLGLFSKETTLMILPFIIALELNKLRRHDSSSHSLVALRLLPYLGAATLYVIMRWMTLSKLGIQTSIVPGFGSSLLKAIYVTDSLSTRIINNIYIIPRYLLTVIKPTALASRYVIPDDLNLLALPLFGAWLCILTGLGWLLTRGRSHASLFGVSWLVLLWLPVSGIVIIPGAPLADRFLYIPAIGLWIVLSDQLTRMIQLSKPEVQKYCFAAIAVLLLALAGLTVRRNMDWKDNLTLYTRFVAQYPDNIHARAGLGKVYYWEARHKNPAMAEQEFEKVVSLEPNFPMIYTYLGNIKLNKDDLNGALQSYSKAIGVYPIDKEAHLNRAITLEKLGRPKEALTDYIFFLTSPGSSDNVPGGREHAEMRLRELSK